MTSRIFARIAGLTCFIVAMFSGRASAQEIKYERLASLYGVTICYKDRGYSFIQTGLSAMDEADVRVHEAKHREQYTRYKSCNAFVKYYTTPKGRMASEAEAYHAGWCVAIKMGADSTSRRNLYVQTIEHELGGEMNRLQIIQEFVKYDPCPK